jgi:glucose 1-dehydrogenase
MLLEGKSMIVTGGNSGIGEAIVLAAAAEGASVVIDYIAHPDETKEIIGRIEKLGGRAVGVQADVSKVGDLQRMVQTAVENFGRLDVLVNNAGMETRTSVLDTTEDQFDTVLGVNLKSAFFGTQFAAKQMIAQGGGGRIINVSSVVATQPIAELSAYVTAKGGIIGLTKTLAVELGPHGITVNAISPGATDTPLNQVAYTAEVRRNYEHRIPLGRIASAEEIADPIVFLASDASRYMTGHEQVVDGGMVLNGNVGHART